MNFVSIDFETANEKRFSPCAIGVVVANENEIIDEYYSLINPLMNFNSFNTYIHGITANDVSDAPTFSELWPKLDSYLSNNLVIAHNASFDMSVIRQTLDYFKLPYPKMDYLCTANISKRVWPDLENHKLNTLAAHHQIIFEHHHALEDARVAAKIFMKALKEKHANNLDILLETCNMTKGRIYERGYVPPKSKRARKSKRIYF
ncbi:hypothetical protein CIL03_13875 [Virgibacillus indicus]|uniref:Exonuclease domain-containing protein n=1 Tax=Virgibacillus indicus TaxID=2024554 RepID=A0A265N8K7_9BACI|nr:3'-5' exonuclease [Virgibacillus indicus]OZU87794.1 hypothetical protein CIL03_13875 [Virgibacillus indicus]